MHQRILILIALFVFTTASYPRHATAALVILNDRNSEVRTDLFTNFNVWNVDGTDHLKQEWFWIRVNDDPKETIITSLNKDAFQYGDGNLEPGDDRLFVRWFDPFDRFELTFEQVLTGGPVGSGVSDVTHTVRIVNLTDEPLDVNLFQLADFDLIGTETGDTVEFVSANVVEQTELNSIMRETFTTHSPATTQVGMAGSILASLTDNAKTNLDGSVGPFSAADVEYAVQWTETIPVGGAFVVNKSLLISSADSIVPEPGAFVTLSAGVLLFVLRHRPSRANTRSRESKGNH
ncbi:MAG: hypothetical protein R3C10_23325 [Pirellulales bacterium]